MEEIIDLEELNEDVLDENLKEFMSKDEETEKLLNSKIDELAKEEEKLSKKESEVKSLEESNREKISSNASADELIEIAGKLKEAEAELAEINENVSKLTEEKEELLSTKENIEKSKKEYIKSLNSTNSNYEEQLKKISEAIEVCDNPTLKQVLEDVKNEKTRELNDLEVKRINELKNVLNEPVEEEKTELESVTIETKVEPEEKQNNYIQESQIDELINRINQQVRELNEQRNEVVNNDVPIIDTDNIIPTISEDLNPIVNNDLLSTPTEDIKIPQEDSGMINLDAILEDVPKASLDSITPDSLVIPEVNQVDEKSENKIKIIYEKDVPESLLKEIYSSSKIMPALYDYLDNKNVNEGSFN